MNMASGWREVAAELDCWAQAGLAARFWLRDDDAIEPSAALDRLIGWSEKFAVPVLLAVIPAPATPALARRIADRPLISPCQHGLAHINHALKGEKSAELGSQRPAADVIADLRLGQKRMRDLFGAAAAQVLVPPWNRINPALMQELPELGFTAISTFGPPHLPVPPGLAEINAHIDIIDWKNGKKGWSPDKVTADLVCELQKARLGGGQPLGILTHHLVHDDTAWAVIGGLAGIIAGHPSAGWMAFTQGHSADTFP